MKATRNSFPIGVERVLYTAAVDSEFREVLHQSRIRAVVERGLPINSTELAMLRAIPSHQLDAVIDNMDISPDNVDRRTILSAVATTTATIAVGEVLSGCATGTGPDTPKPKTDAGAKSKDGGDAKDGGKPQDGLGDLFVDLKKD